jgi:hypothetical protein
LQFGLQKSAECNAIAWHFGLQEEAECNAIALQFGLLCSGWFALCNANQFISRLVDRMATVIACRPVLS